MKKLICILVLVVLISGCTTLESFRMKNRQNLLKLSIGMTKEEALQTMGYKTVIGLESGVPDAYSSMKAKNPYHSEILVGENKKLEVIYYYTDLKSSDYAITDDELTPLIFDEGKLIGWGNSFLQDNIQKYEIRVR